MRRPAGGSPEACALSRGLRFSICARSDLPRPQRPARIFTGQFNEGVQGDVVHIKDMAGETHWYLVLVDEATDFTVVVMVRCKGLRQRARRRW